MPTISSQKLCIRCRTSSASAWASRRTSSQRRKASSRLPPGSAIASTRTPLPAAWANSASWVSELSALTSETPACNSPRRPFTASSAAFAAPARTSRSSSSSAVRNPVTATWSSSLALCLALSNSAAKLSAVDACAVSKRPSSAARPSSNSRRSSAPPSPRPSEAAASAVASASAAQSATPRRLVVTSSSRACIFSPSFSFSSAIFDSSSSATARSPFRIAMSEASCWRRCASPCSRRPCSMLSLSSPASCSRRRRVCASAAPPWRSHASSLGRATSRCRAPATAPPLMPPASAAAVHGMASSA
mmetsp:Transcript_31461/g.66946  ORF Transcript_31461/g.66946 Transcript_31461/m.66946 type:complete len:304 (-) Transcript_31461:211-1122(-)